MSRKSRILRISVRKHPDVFIVVDADIWTEYLRQGFSKTFSLDKNDGRHRYARTMAYLPDPSLRSVPVALARLFVAIDALLSAKLLPNKGWTVHYQNGNHLDLRRKNLEVITASGHRNSFHASWTTKTRWDIAEAGGDPKAIFAAKRRLFRATHKATIKPDPQSAIPPSPRARKKARRGKP
jgi:predicted RNA binding protein YcfA (HicA-like mRNA interferase family)